MMMNSLIWRPSSDISSNNLCASSNPYGNCVVQNRNSSYNEMTYNLRFNRDKAQSPSSSYVYESQIKDFIKGLEDNICSLLHMDIMGLKKHFDELQFLLDCHN